MGRVIGPWGVRGWIKVAPYGDRPEGLVNQRAWWLDDGDGGWTRRDVGEARVHSGTVIAVPRESLPKAKRGEIYLADLVGLTVVTVSGATLGTVVAVEDYGGHPLMRVAAEASERLVPYVEPIVRSVDLAERRVEVDWEPEY